MTKNIFSISVFTFAILMFIPKINAQEKEAEVTVKISLNGKIVKDTTYQVENENRVKIAGEILDITLGDTKGSDEKKVFVIKNKNGETNTWVSSEEENVHMLREGTSKEETVKISKDKNGKKIIKKEMIIRKEDGNSSPEKQEEKIEWIEKDTHTIILIDEEGSEKVEKIIQENENTEKKIIHSNGKKIIITESEKDGEKVVDVEVIDEESEDVKKKKKK